MATLISTYPYLLALIASLIAESCAILLRLVAPSIGRGFWWLANGVSLLSVSSFLWSFFWAASMREDFREILSIPETMLGVAAITGGGILLVWSLTVLRWRSLFAWPGASLCTRKPYSYLRRPMFVGLAFFFLGMSFLFSSDALWIWLVTWLLLSQIVLELEELELRMRFPDATQYFAQTRRYLPPIGSSR